MASVCNDESRFESLRHERVGSFFFRSFQAHHSRDQHRLRAARLYVRVCVCVSFILVLRSTSPVLATTRAGTLGPSFTPLIPSNSQRCFIFASQTRRSCATFGVCLPCLPHQNPSHQVSNLCFHSRHHAYQPIAWSSMFQAMFVAACPSPACPSCPSKNRVGAVGGGVVREQNPTLETVLRIFLCRVCTVTSNPLTGGVGAVVPSVPKNDHFIVVGRKLWHRWPSTHPSTPLPPVSVSELGASRANLLHLSPHPLGHHPTPPALERPMLCAGPSDFIAL